MSERRPRKRKHKLCVGPTHWHINTMRMRPPGTSGTLSTGGKNTAGGGPLSVGNKVMKQMCLAKEELTLDDVADGLAETVVEKVRSPVVKQRVTDTITGEGVRRGKSRQLSGGPSCGQENNCTGYRLVSMVQLFALMRGDHCLDLRHHQCTTNTGGALRVP